MRPAALVRPRQSTKYGRVNEIGISDPPLNSRFQFWNIASTAETRFLTIGCGLSFTKGCKSVDQKEDGFAEVIGLPTNNSGVPFAGLFAGKYVSTHSFSANAKANAV